MAAGIFLLGILQIVGGVLVAFAAKSAMNEIVGAISFGLGVVGAALGINIAKIDDYVKPS
ncbi:hypothetical protein CN068_31325 [Sinorhizobium meliloti]|uniref:Transmembrane protein n=1 Tax=Sinorhizobium meliloti (strain SM11) TaxID=707241 RepID=F7XA84_SINMM|nr:hypothetical protein [Sinorhizobium meliloti]AEH79180.1 hypothetical protein SM11_chr1913 [Sinorhizobium meliloti SM11]ASP51369.1 hypothetical protein CDO31_07170 [Sinorhizobium meliloti]MBP2467329.1 small-conductance mechanosensitive channel [Sinorhizobium meliloti]MDE3791081.1 hypothetical protein [Sinorhizobium meliloti]MDE4554148.1 hypothetical protein [Sinorhizobium meliloti]